jgi:integrase
MKRKSTDKPPKPYATYPLHAHASGQWAGRINGKVRYFGLWADPGTALERYHAALNGTPYVVPESVGERVDKFRADKKAQLATGDITPVTFGEYEETCKVIEKHFGRGRDLQSLDYNSLRVALSKGKRVTTLSPVTLKRRLVIARMIFPDGKKELKAPAQRLLRAAKAARGEQFYEAKEIRKLVTNAEANLKCFILLGINCAFGPKDCELFHAPEGEWHNFPRPKTGIARRCWLWPETRKALQAKTESWDRWRIAREFKALCEAQKVPNHGFYSLRRTFVTVAEGSQAVIDRICGWVKGDMASIYRQRTFDDKLRACSAGVRAWYMEGATASKEGEHVGG